MSEPSAVRIIAGPTASGKSAHALHLAWEMGGVIINADSLQIYDGLPLLTAQPSPEERESLPHKLYSALPPAEICSAAQWRAMALSEIRAALAQGKNPLIVGGTGFYIQALMEGFSPIPDIDPAIRTAVTARQEALGNPAFHAALAAHDPVMAARLHPQDTQRLIRAWEVLEGTGRSLAEWQALPPEGAPEGLRFEITLILPDRDRLYERCNSRFLQMLKSGALAEAEEFAIRLDQGLVPEQAALTHALGFQPLRAHLQGSLSREEAIEKGQTETRQYAKRQVTWFRNQILKKYPDSLILTPA